MKKTKLVALLLVLALCVSLLAGCGSKANDTANSNGDAATNEPASNETGSNETGSESTGDTASS